MFPSALIKSLFFTCHQRVAFILRSLLLFFSLFFFRFAIYCSPVFWWIVLLVLNRILFHRRNLLHRSPFGDYSDPAQRRIILLKLSAEQILHARHSESVIVYIYFVDKFMDESFISLYFINLIIVINKWNAWYTYIYIIKWGRNSSCRDFNASFRT